MSVKCMSLVWELELPPSQKIVLLKLADNANDQGLCWPALGTVAKLCCLSIRTVQMCISDLEDEGLISRQMVPGKVTKYTLHLDVTPAFPALVQNLRGCKPQRKTPATVAPPPPQSTTLPYIEEPSLEPSLEPSPGAREISKRDVDEEFNTRFWPNVPNKDGKLRAQAAFHDARHKVPLSVILAGLARWRGACAAEDAKSDFAPHSKRLPANWLIEERWTDEGTVNASADAGDNPAATPQQLAAVEASLPALWARHPQAASRKQAILEFRLDRAVPWALPDRAKQLLAEFERTGIPPAIRKPVTPGDARAGPVNFRQAG